MYLSCATSSIFPERVCCNSPSAAMLENHHLPKITRPTQSYTQVLTTTPRRANGSSSCRTAISKSFWNYLKQPQGDVRNAAPEMIRLAWSSPAALAITPLQDLLNLGREGRMNVPGEASGNWRWRATPHMLSSPSFEWLRQLTNDMNRTAPVRSSIAEVAR